MSIFKTTMLFEIATNQSGLSVPSVTRVAGWSESWYIQNVTLGEARQYFLGPAPDGGPGLCSARAALLPITGRIVGERIQEVGVVGPSQSIGQTFPGGSAITDVPWMGLLCSATPTGIGKARRFTIRGIPDTFIVEGEFRPTSAYQTRLNEFFAELGDFSIRGQDTTQPKFTLTTISGTGLAKTVLANPFAPNDMVKIVGAKDALNVLRSGTFRVLNTLPLTFEFQLQGWTYGLCVGGTAQLAVPAFPFLAGSPPRTVIRVVNRKVGRPFSGYRGRASKRKKTA